MSVIQNIEVSVSEGLICETLYGHAFETFNLMLVRIIAMAVFRESSILWVWLNCPLSGVFLVFRVDNWGRITVRYTE